MDFYWHLIWTVYPVPTPDKQRASDYGLRDLYDEFQNQGINVELSAPLSSSISQKVVRPDEAIDNPADLKSNILELTAIGGDRIAGGLPVLAIAVKADRVELLVHYGGTDLIQKIARVKSRSAPLLSWRNRSENGGRQTWSKGIWYAKSPDQRFAERVQARLTRHTGNRARRTAETGVNKKGISELHSAAYHEDIEWLKQCVRNGLDVNLKDDSGWTPLVWAIHMASTSRPGEAEAIIQYLYEHGASLDIEPRDGESLIEFAEDVDPDVASFVKRLVKS